MFYKEGILLRSDVFSHKVGHGFSGKVGGVSAHPYTASLNLAMGREDSDDVVRENIDIFARAVSDGRYGMEQAICAPQIHSDKVRIVTTENWGEGVIRSSSFEGDGFVTDQKGVLVFVRIADCTPILLSGEKTDGSPVVSAVHAGWRGTAKGIAARAVEKMCALGCECGSICAAIGPHIGACCYEVGGDLLDEVILLRGRDFAERYVTPSPHVKGKFICDLSGMNRALLLEAGVSDKNIDVSDHCTFCRSEEYYSHRKTAGKRGAMGAGIVII